MPDIEDQERVLLLTTPDAQHSVAAFRSRNAKH